MIPRNAILYKPDPETGDNVLMTPEECAVWWAEHDARAAARDELRRQTPPAADPPD